MEEETAFKVPEFVPAVVYTCAEEFYKEGEGKGEGERERREGGRDQEGAVLGRKTSFSTYPFPSLSRGAVVAVTTCTPSGHHWKWVESLA